MAKRKIIKIDEDKCNGCGLCIPNCKEGALKIIDGKVKLISDQFCDGLGACLGHCPQDAITIEEREADPFDEKIVTENLEKCGCPGARMIDFSQDNRSSGSEEGKRASELKQWPVQLHLVPPNAPYFKDKEVLLAADCVAYALADFHKDHLKGKSLAIACPKLDEGQDIYLEKLKAMIDQAKIKSLTVMIMEVPCCGGLRHLAETAIDQAKRNIPLNTIVVGLDGGIISK